MSTTAAGPRLTPGRVVKSEWLKLATLRSFAVAYGVIALSLVVVSGVALTSSDTSGSDALLTGVTLVELLVGITAVMAVTGEYAAQTVLPTFTVVPRRTPVVWAKLLVHGGLVAILVVPATLVALTAGHLFAPDDVRALTDAGVVRAIGGSALVLVATSVIGVAAGLLTRSAPAAIGVLLALVFLPVLVTVWPQVTAYVPGRAAQAVVIADNPPEAHLLPGASAAVVLAVWCALLVATALIAVRRRDA